MKQTHKSLFARWKSFIYAFNGLKIIWQAEINFRIHVFAVGCVVLFGFLYNISASEWLVLLLAMGMVLAFETINTAIEQVTDFVSPEWNDPIKKVKDLAAAAVLIAAMSSLIIGVIIFLPKILQSLE